MKLQDKYEVKRAAKHPLAIEVPGSKSITNRALLIAALCEGKSELENVLFSDDSRCFLHALEELGFPVETDEAGAKVCITGFGGKIPAVENKNGGQPEVYVGSAGTAARFLTAFLGLSEGNFRIHSSEQMKRRPMQELLQALEGLGAEISFEEEPYHFPFRIWNHGIKKYEVTIDVDRSSQFLSALLISSVLFTEDFLIHVKGRHGMAYVEMTMAMMAAFGVQVTRKDKNTFLISGNAAYKARNYRIEPDISAAAYFYAMCPVLGVPAKVMHVRTDCLQGDIQFLRVLEQMGCRLKEETGGILLEPPENGKLHGGTFDLSAFSDQALTLAAVSMFADSDVTITGIGHIRYQECDRIQAILTNLSGMGIDCEQPGEDSIRIHPGKPHGCEIETFSDHRVAMAFAIPGLVTDNIIIKNPSCCGKTFENYFEILEEQVIKEPG